MTEYTPGNVEPRDTIHIRKARRDFLDHKRNTIKESSARAYEYPTKDFIEFLEENGVEATGEIDGYLVEQWKQKRYSEVKPVTVHNNVKHVRVFIKWMQNSELVEYGLYDKVAVPQLSKKQAVSNEVLDADQAEEISDFLETYEYATRWHALFELMWHVGCRISGAIALDMDDFKVNLGDKLLHFRDRPDLGTPLKNGAKSERNVTISDSVSTVLNDYIAVHRDDVKDDNDRDPLFTTSSGRLKRQMAYRNISAYSRPCALGKTCPHDKDEKTCPAARQKKQSS